MSVAASQIVLAETDVELTLLGSLFLDPDAFGRYAPAIKSEWFGDEFARYLFDACMRIHDAGNRLTPATVTAAMPLDLGGISRGEFYARACAAGLPDINIAGLVATLKDRWARRSLVNMAERSSAAAITFEADPYDIASGCLLDLDRILEVKAEKVGGSLLRATRALIADIENPDQQRGATTGIRILDVKLNGYRRGQLYVIAGRPGMGKSAFMCSSLRRTAASGAGVAIFSLEMTEQEIASRMISDAMDSLKAPSYGTILKGELSDEQKADVYNAAEDVAACPMHIDDSARLTFAQIAAKARRLKMEMAGAGVRLGVVCIDHMGLVTPSDRYAGNKVAEAGEVSGRARALAKELDCCVVLLCQLSREVEKRDDKRPVMSDLRWSGEIEQDAHVIGFLYREEYYLNQQADADFEALRDARNKMEFLIRKNRNGATDDVRLWCSIAHSSIRDNP
jgi:replicative DNA helicase